MNQDNRVLLRMGARDLTSEEIDRVNGGDKPNNPTGCIVTRCPNLVDGILCDQ